MGLGTKEEGFPLTQHKDACRIEKAGKVSFNQEPGK